MLPTTKALRKTGLDVLGDRPWGTHFCVFYETAEDLMQILMPYFKAGLQNNEFCFWVLADSFDEDDARHALNEFVPKALYKLRDRLSGWQIVHQTGLRDVDATKALIQSLGCCSLRGGKAGGCGAEPEPSSRPEVRSRVLRRNAS